MVVSEFAASLSLTFASYPLWTSAWYVQGRRLGLWMKGRRILGLLVGFYRYGSWVFGELVKR
jgi:hypothetical protein